MTALRAEMPALRDTVYLNTGTLGVTAPPVLRVLLDEVTQFEQQGELLFLPLQARMDAARTRLARLLGADADEVAFTRNATEGVNLVAWGLPWTEHDEVLISDEEHPAVDVPWQHLSNNGGPRVRRFQVHADPEATLASVREGLTARTRLVATSHVSCVSGTRLPVREICRLAAEHGALSLLDGAQAVGQLPVHLPEIGADFYVGNGHKWLHGPKGTGFLYVRRDRLDLLKAQHVGPWSFVKPIHLESLQHEHSARRYEYGTRNYPTYVALGAAVDYLESLGWDRLEARMRDLSTELKERLREVPGLALVSPHPWQQSSALVAFRVDGLDPNLVKPVLWEQHRIRLRTFPARPVMRASTAYFNTSDDLAALVRALKVMAGGAA